MVNERINKNYPSQATGILHAPEWKNKKKKNRASANKKDKKNKKILQANNLKR